MKTKSSPSEYRYCISRRSTVAVSTLVPALNVRSTTWPVSTFFSLVRTNAPPLPGLTCWNSTTFHSTPSRSSVMPFFRSLVVATAVVLLDLDQLAGGLGERVGAARADQHGVLDADPASTREVDAGLDGHRYAVGESIRRRPGHEERRLVDLQADPVAQTVRRLMPRSLDLLPRHRVELHRQRTGDGGVPAGLLDL